MREGTLLMNKDEAVVMEVQFTEPADVKAFGDGWHRYDELAYIMLPGRDLIAVETLLEVPFEVVMRSFRGTATFGELAAAWLAVRASDPQAAGDFADFSPIIKTARWRAAVEEAPGKAFSPAGGETPSETGTDPTGTPASPSTPDTESAT